MMMLLNYEVGFLFKDAGCMIRTDGKLRVRPLKNNLRKGRKN